MPPKKIKTKKVTKRSIIVQGFNIQSDGNILKGASVENNTTESGAAEEELIIQGFNLPENSNNNNLENTSVKNNKVVENYDSESDGDKASELAEKKVQLQKNDEEFKKTLEELCLGLNNMKKMVKAEEGIDQVPTPNQPVTQVQLTLEKLIGKGGYGGVYWGKWKGQDVAVKKMHLPPNTISQNDIKEIMNEANILKILKSEYIIRYHGLYSDDQQFLIIMDYAENGALTDFINDRQNQSQDWSLNKKLIIQMTQGINYIHQQGIIHRDLKSMNILLDRDYKVKISDFGLAKIKTISSSKSRYSSAVGTLGWMAPEVLREQKYSEQSDIYSLGMVIWEIAAKCTLPYKSITNDALVRLHVVEDNKREKIPDSTPVNVRTIIEGCWKKEPDERITLTNLLIMIDPNQEKIAVELANQEKLSDGSVKSVLGNSEELFIINFNWEQEQKVQSQIEVLTKKKN